MSLFRTFLPLSRTLKMLHVRFPHFLLSAFRRNKRFLSGNKRLVFGNTWLLLRNNRLVLAD
jgi:hypothetical protein